MSVKQVKMMKIARRRYSRPLHKLTTAQMRVVAAEASGVRLVADVVDVASALHDMRSGKTVSLEVLNERKEACANCEFAIVLADGQPACTDCGCSGHTMLEAKLNWTKKKCRKWLR